MVLKVLLKFGVWCLLYIINIQGMYLYVYIIVGVYCILDGQHRRKYRKVKSYMYT